MNKLKEEEIIKELLNGINDKSISKIDIKQVNHTKEVHNEKNYCIAAKKHSTKEKAKQAIEYGIDVYIIEKPQNGVHKTYAYSRCCKTTVDDKKFCSIHLRTIMCRESQSQTKGEIDPLEIFDRDILPRDSNDKSRRFATVDDEYFKNTGKRGAKKKSIKCNDISYTDLVSISTQFFKENDVSLVEFVTKLIKHENTENFLYHFMIENQVHPDTLLHMFHKHKEVSSSIFNENIIKKIDNINNMDEIDEIDEMDDANSIENESVEVESIQTEIDIQKPLSNLVDLSSYDISILEKIGEFEDRILMYHPFQNSIYEDTKDGTVLGIFIEVSDKYHMIIYETKKYTVAVKRIHSKKGLLHICVFTNRVFNAKYKYIGTSSKIDSKKYFYEDEECMEDNDTLDEIEDELDPSLLVDITIQEKQYQYYPLKNIVLTITDSYECLGYLTDIVESYYTFMYHDIPYTVAQKGIHPTFGEVYICSLTQRVFNSSFEWIGKSEKISSSKYSFQKK